MSIEKIQLNSKYYNDDINITFSKNLRILMSLNCVKQKQISEATGKSVSAVSSWIRGAALPSIAIIKELAIYFKVSESYFLGTSEKEIIFSNETAEKEDNKRENSEIIAEIRSSFESIIERAEKCEGGLHHLNIELKRTFPENLYR